MSSWRVHSGRAFRALKYWASPVSSLNEDAGLGSEVSAQSAFSPKANELSRAEGAELQLTSPSGIVGPVFGFLDKYPAREMTLSPILTWSEPVSRFLLSGMLGFCDLCGDMSNPLSNENEPGLGFRLKFYRPTAHKKLIQNGLGLSSCADLADEDAESDSNFHPKSLCHQMLLLTRSWKQARPTDAVAGSVGLARPLHPRGG